ncbi:MAG: hypothetical protein KatS3mg129_3175 [Leptospiraceae bacterium]|nr:MAG: hypothetical protein KatS3mg129_3175 [Leptospiraceae bacterium]
MEIVESIAKILIPLIPIVGIITGGIVIILFFKWYFEYKKYLIDSGKYQPFQIKDFRIFILLLGILSLSSGIAITIVFIIVGSYSYGLLGGLIPLFVGIGLIVFYILTIRQ